jgi:hypothetical protein
MVTLLTDVILSLFLGDPCAQNPCLNGGQCYPNNLGGFSCQCQPGYSGQRCEDRKNIILFSDCMIYPLNITLGDPCASQPCMNQGNCIRENGNFRCICAPGYTGTRCEIRDACQNNPCMNGGTCQSSNSNIGYICVCPSGFSGLRCETSMHIARF